MRTKAVALLLVLASVRFAAAVEVRQPEPRYKRGFLTDRSYFTSALTRAYAACVSPNDVASDGTPACSPAVSSVCTFERGFVTIASEPRGTPFFNLGLEQLDGPGSCGDGPYFLDVAVRATIDPYDGEVASCNAGSCTFEDVVMHLPLEFGLTTRASGLLDELPMLGIRDGNFEVMGATVIAPDGLPMAATGLGVLGNADRVTSFMSLAYPACTAPGPEGSCDAAPTSAACDFESGTLVWELDQITDLPFLTVQLQDLAGMPSCSIGPYRVDTTLRVTADACGGGNVRCTLVDTTVSRSVSLKKADLDARVDLGPASVTTQVLATRVFDPTGSPLAAAALTGSRSLARTKVQVKGRDLRLKTAYPPVEAIDQFIAPTVGPTTITLASHGTVFYGVTIPGAVWQLGLPLGERFDYADPGGVLGGIRNIRIKKLPGTGVYDVQMRVSDVDFSAIDFPSVTVTIGIPRDPDEFPEPVTTFSRAQQTRTCKLKPGPKMACR